MHAALVMDGELDATRLEIVINAPQPDGSLHLIGADSLVCADAWHATHASPPELMGQRLPLCEAPNRFGLPVFYTLHGWAWENSATGAFVHWHANVSCDAFSGPSLTSGARCRGDGGAMGCRREQGAEVEPRPPLRRGARPRRGE